MKQFFIRLGALGEISLGDSMIDLERGTRVIVRTGRGLELAEVVGRGARNGAEKAVAVSAEVSSAAIHRIVRATTQQDELLIRRLARHKRKAIEDCRKALEEAGSKTTLLDVDQVLDGGTLVMHFLGPVDRIAESITKRIVSKYEDVIRSRHLSKLLIEGCGPGCGEGSDSGCATGCAGSACAGCGIRSKDPAPETASSD